MKGENNGNDRYMENWKRLDYVIDYTTNIEKTLNSDYGKETYKKLHVIEYAEADFKTENQYYVSSLKHCK